MLFSKKQKKTHKPQKDIYLAQLSRAVSVYNDDISLIAYSGNIFDPELPVTYPINDKLSITIRDFQAPSTYNDFYWLHIGLSMNIDVYLEDIKMSSFKFFIDKDFLGETMPIQPWKCISEEVFHEMPEQFIDAINAWSYDVLAKFEKEQKAYNKKKKEDEQARYEEEEQRLQMYR